MHSNSTGDDETDDIVVFQISGHAFTLGEGQDGFNFISLEDNEVEFNANLINVKNKNSSNLLEFSDNAIAHYYVGDTKIKDYEIDFSTSGISFSYLHENLAQISKGKVDILTPTLSVAKDLIYGDETGQMNYQQVDGGYDLFIS